MIIMMPIMGLDIGGAETHVLELTKGLCKLGHQVIVISNGGVYLEDIEKAGAIHIHAPLTSRRPENLVKSFFILRKAIKQYKPDIVHAHARIPAFLCGLINKTLPFHFVTTAHFPFDVSFGLKLLSNWGSRAIAVSDDLKTYLIDNYHYPAKKIGVTVNGIDTGRFRPGVICTGFLYEMGLSMDAPRIVCVSRLNDDVCPHIFDLLSIFDELQREIIGLELVIVGNGNVYEELVKKANEINSHLGRRAVIMTGARTDIEEILQCATISIGVSRAILEPMAMAKPVIITGVAGYIGVFDHSKLEEAIHTNFTCRGCKPLSLNEYKEDILKLFSLTGEERWAMGEYCRRVVKQYYSISRMVNDNLRMYKEALESGTYDVLIMGYYGYKNSGDEALLQAVVSELRSKDPLMRISVMSYNPQETMHLYGVDSFNRFNVWKLWKTLGKTKLFIAGGGNLIQDVTSTKSLLYYIWCIKIAKWAGTKVMLYANGIGPIVRGINKKRVSKTLNTVDYITLRDEESREELSKLAINVPPIVVTADPAFALCECDQTCTNDILARLGIGKDEKYVCISVREWKEAPRNFIQLMAEMGDYIAKEHHYTPIFIPMHYPYDAYVGRNIMKRMECKSIFIDECLNLTQTFALIRHSELVISVRLHMLVYASMLAVPAVGIIYDPKVSSFQKYIGQAYYMDPRALVAGDYKGLIDKCIRSSDEIKSNLRQNVESMRQKAHVSTEIAIGLIRGESV